MSEFKNRIRDWEINDKKFKSPTIFAKLQSNDEYFIFNDLVNKFGLNHIAGYVVDVCKLPSVFPNIPLDKKQEVLIKHRKDNKILIIDSSFYKLFSSSNNELKNFYKLKPLFPKSKNLFAKIQKILNFHKIKNNLKEQKKNKSKKEQKIIDRRIALVNNNINENKINEQDINMAFYEELFRLQVHYSSDIISIPSIPISYQMNKSDIENCFKTTSNAVNLANTLYPESKKMLVLCLKKNALLRGTKISPEDEEKIDFSSKYPFIPKDFFTMVEETLPERERLWGTTLRMNTFSKMNVDFIGLKIVDYQIEPLSEIVLVYFTSFLRDLIDDKYLHFFDMDETFYVLFSRGADSYSCPVSKKPFFARSTGISLEGNWYHPIDKLYYPRNRTAINLYDMQKEDGYRIPCPCKICETYETFMKIEEDAKEKAKNSKKKVEKELVDLWNEYRRRHWFCYKDIELEELQRDDSRLIKEEIIRSRRQDLHSFFK